jgi:acyl-CoA reductase-like NAD-dependent aldehyde dehydrogenase
VIQADEEKLPPPGSPKVLKSPSSLRTVAVIDRTSNVEEAAGAIASSKLSFSGRSTYSPDLVLVNEFVADQFLSALVKFVAGPMTRAGPSKARHSNALGEAEKLVKDIEKGEAGRVIVAGINGSIIEVHDG